MHHVAVWHAEDLLKVLEQQAHSAVSQESSGPSTSGQGTADGPVRPINRRDPPASPPQPSSTLKVRLALGIHEVPGGRLALDHSDSTAYI